MRIVTCQDTASAAVTAGTPRPTPTASQPPANPNRPAIWSTTFGTTYDYMGRRVRKRSYSGSAITGWTLEADPRFIYDGWNLIARFSPTLIENG